MVIKQEERLLASHLFLFRCSPAERARPGQAGSDRGRSGESPGLLPAGGGAARHAGKSRRGAALAGSGRHRGGDDQTAAAGVQGRTRWV